MGFRALRVINEDVIAGGAGFREHPHDNMEIITIVLSGALRHRDSMGNSTVIRAGDVQRMSAGTGVVHSEFSDLTDEKTHLLQIWIEPKTLGGSPSYAQKNFPPFVGQYLIVSGDGRDESITILQDVDLYRGFANVPGAEFRFHLRAGRGAWLQMISGAIEVNGARESAKLGTGDALWVLDAGDYVISVPTPEASWLLLDLA